jgi:AraC-like DNA-binding protein
VTCRQLQRYFLQVFDCHPRDFLKDLRKKDALRFRRQGLLDKEIAQRLGFKQASHFSRVFGQHRQMPVRATRKPVKARRMDK